MICRRTKTATIYLSGDRIIMFSYAVPVERFVNGLKTAIATLILAGSLAISYFGTVS